MKRYLEIGKITGTRGLNGEIKVEPWCDSPEILAGFKVVYLKENNQALKIACARVHKSMVIMSIDGINTIDEAEKLKNKIINIDRSDLKLEKGQYFIQDLIGLEVIDIDSGLVYGELTDVFKTGANDVYQVTGTDKKNYLVPVIPDIVKEVNLDASQIKIRPIKGIFDNED